VDDLIAGAARESDDIDEIIRMAEAGIKPPKKDSLPAPNLPTPPAAVSTPTAEPVKDEPPAKTEAPPPEKKSKKDKPIRMVYSDDELSPEERMAKMPRYAFVPDGKIETPVAGASTVPGVSGTVDA
jgi:hypothetical protein